jgi:hypothetical protein
MDINKIITKSELISKFKDGEKRYRESALFHKVIDTILHGGDEITIIDQLIEINDSTIKELTDYIERTNPPTRFY